MHFIRNVAGHRPSARVRWGGLRLLLERKVFFVMVDLPGKFYPEEKL